jgi:hypothetical protein
MKGLARRLAVQTLSQILTFGLCASSTESAMQHLAQRHAPAVRTNASANHDPAEERKLRDAILRIQADEKTLARASSQSENEQKDKPSLLGPEKGCPEPQKADYKPSEPLDKI